MACLIAGGDSFTYGSELLDCFQVADPANGIDLPHEVASNSTYSALIAKEMKLDYICAAVPGFSNEAIRRSTMDLCNQHIDDIKLVMIMWSFPGRYEFNFSSNWEQLSAWTIIDDMEEIKKDFHIDNPIVFQHHADNLIRAKNLGITDFAKIFYNKIGSFEYWEVYNSLVNIVMLQQYLELKQIPYIFTGVDNCIIANTSRYTDDLTITTLLDQINFKNWLWFSKEQGFYTWAKENKFPFGTTHPLEEAHIEAAHIIYEHLRNLGRVS